MQRKGSWATRTGHGIRESTVGMVWAEVCPGSKCIRFPLSCSGSPGGKGIVLSTCCVVPKEVAALLSRLPGMFSLLPSRSSELLGPPRSGCVHCRPKCHGACALALQFTPLSCACVLARAPQEADAKKNYTCKDFIRGDAASLGGSPRLGEVSEAESKEAQPCRGGSLSPSRLPVLLRSLMGAVTVRAASGMVASAKQDPVFQSSPARTLASFVVGGL